MISLHVVIENVARKTPNIVYRNDIKRKQIPLLVAPRCGGRQPRGLRPEVARAPARPRPSSTNPRRAARQGVPTPDTPGTLTHHSPTKIIICYF